ncbi:right-handed parallel beta-helix repeat-containing protein [Novispirillum itersonii]|uniref:right-handed parallel beta-helix repeat-containing protein n=1 Tax=Novispirillum itersonii TaxID=189 RepID=UPI00036F97D1|nr:right-handed parallel beta-helix repeat-containing protein [Novispirillum itersonii]
MRPYPFRHALLAATALPFLLSAAALAAEDKWGPSVEAGAKIGSKRKIGESDLFLPLAQDEQRLLFADIRGSIDEDSQREGNFGLGYRQMLDSGWNLGGYGYFDRRRSETGHYYSQATVGLEALGTDFDVRLNGYLPLGTKERDVPGSTAVELTDTSIRMSNAVERSYHGGDAEIGWRVPVFAAEEDRELRLYGGGYWFDAADSKEVAGPRLRMELRLYDLTEDLPGSRLTLSGEVQHDRPRGTQEFFGFRLRLPLQAEASDRRLTAQERRMTDPVVRDVDIVTQAARVEEAVTMDGQAIDQVRQLSGSTLQAQLNSAPAGTLLLLNGNATVSAPVTLVAGQVVRGGGATLTLTGASSGRTVQYVIPGSSGTIRGAVAGDAVVKMGTDSTLRDVRVENTSAAAGSWAVSASNTSGAALRNVTMVSSGGGLQASNATNLTVTGSRITAAQDSAARITGGSGLSFTDNTLTQNGASSMGFRADNAAGTLRGNTITTNGNGNGLEDTNGSALPSHAVQLNNSAGLTVSGNTITTNGTQANGLHVTNSGGITLSGNTITTNNYMSRGIHLQNSNGSTLSGNTITTNTTDDSNWSILTISFGILSSDSTNLTISDNTISTQMRGAYGINLRSGDNSTLSGNTVTVRGTDTAAVNVLRSETVTVRNNTLTANGTGASSGLLFGVNSHNGLVENNTITATGAKSVATNAANGLVVRNNRLVGQGNSGVYDSVGDATVTGNTP